MTRRRVGLSVLLTIAIGVGAALDHYSSAVDRLIRLHWAAEDRIHARLDKIEAALDETARKVAAVPILDLKPTPKPTPKPTQKAMQKPPPPMPPEGLSIR